MTITGTPPAPGASDKQSSLGAGASVMGKEDFLKLLVTQLGNQDPLNPMDGQQFAAQLAQFTSVEQLVNLNASMGSQSEMSGLMAQNINNGVATGLIGKQVEVESNQINLLSGGKPDISFEAASAAAGAEIVITDASGKTVRTLAVQDLIGGKNEVSWDGKDARGNTLPEGAYAFTIKAKDVNGDAVETAPRLNGQVDRVSFGPEGIRLWIGQSSVSLAAVVSVQQPES